MACRFEITLPIAEQAGVSLASAALAEAARLEQQLSHHPAKPWQTFGGVNEFR
jgi:hypothetical protein